MKVISFFSRFTIICNSCFLLFVFLGKFESGKHVAPGADKVVAVSYLKDVIITLGISAIIINLLMCIVYSVIVIIGRQRLLPKWLVIVNFLFLILEFLYFFFRWKEFEEGSRLKVEGSRFEKSSNLDLIFLFENRSNNLINRQRNTFCRKIIPVYKTKRFYFSFFLVDFHLVLIKIKFFIS